MTEEDEDKIIQRAQDILERRMAVEKDIKINLHRLVYYSAYYQGAMAAVRAVTELLRAEKPKGESWIYKEAEWDLITKSKRMMQLYLDGTPMRFRNHKKNNKNKLKSVEAYFCEYVSVIREVK